MIIDIHMSLNMIRLFMNEFLGQYFGFVAFYNYFYGWFCNLLLCKGISSVNYPVFLMSYLMKYGFKNIVYFILNIK